MSAVAGLAKVAKTRTLSASNPQMVNRVVGYLEYGRALALLDRLLDVATPAELEVIDSLVRDRDEFAVYTNLSRRLELGPSKLGERKADKDNWQQRGLAWVMALARVELGATVAGFTDQPDPFSGIRPSRLEMPAYSEILADSMRTHYWALRSDPMVKSLNFPGEPQAIAYARRVTVAIEFLRASRMNDEFQYTVEQLIELDAWENELAELQRNILFGVLRLDDPATIALKQSMFQNSCGRLLGVARKELPLNKAAGSAPSLPSISTPAGPGPQGADKPPIKGSAPKTAPSPFKSGT